MPSYDSIVVGEDWISEHYFTTDSPRESFQGKVIELRKQWDDEATEGRETVRQRLLAVGRDLQTALSALAENPGGAAAAHALVRSSLGFDEPLTDFEGERAGTELRLPQAQLEGVTSTLFFQASPVTTVDELLDPDTGQLVVAGEEDGKPLAAVSKAVSAAFRADEPPAFIVVQAGQWMLLAEAERWAEGRYLAVDLLVVLERRDDRRGGEMDRLAAMLGRQSLVPNADGNIWWTGVLEDSIKHTVGVSKDLREGIRLSIEIIANDVVRRRAAQSLPLDEIDAQQLAMHSLRFLYRILFLLYAEASPEMRVLPLGAPEYGEGYGLDRLRELTLTELVSPAAKDGTHLYESLATLFRLVDRGHSPAKADVADDPAPGLAFNALRADLFTKEATSLIDEVGLSNEATQRVLEHLLLSKESKRQRGSERGFISYAELGINQLGAVYERLMAYTGFFAKEDLYEVAKNGDPEKGSWVVPVSRADHLSRSDFVTTLDEATGESVPVIHRQGTFVFRLAGRERQQSASYYTPDVLTKFVVSQALDELLDQDGQRTTPEHILQLSICEPALGSGAFAIEAVRQLAAEYLKRRQEDLGEIIEAEQYQVELQKVKAHIALHQVYGVDLNATAVELAEISLWLDTMVAELQAPWFGLHLRRGNSLIGARRAVYAPGLLAKKAWLTTVPQDVQHGEKIGAGIHHFLLPSQGWGAAIDTAEAKTYAPERREALRLWRNRIRANPSATIKKRLAALAQRVETLWDLTLRRLAIAESEIRRDIALWGQQKAEKSEYSVTREQIEAVLCDENGAYRRLRRGMDAWCALWSWPLTTDIEPPDWDQWVSGLEAIMGIQAKESKFEKLGQTSLAGDLSWQELDLAEDTDRTFSQSVSIGKALREFSWLQVTQAIAVDQGFFHWELDFAPVFASGGFDLQLGNPPWVRPDWDEAGVLAESDPWWKLAENASESAIKDNRETALSSPDALATYLDERATQIGQTDMLASIVDRPILAGIRTDLYRCFMERAWRSMAPDGICALIHPDGHFSDPNAEKFRAICYRRLLRHWHFRNELKLFDIGNKEQYGVQIYGHSKDDVSFLHGTTLYHPSTVERSLRHDGSGEAPGIKDANGRWDVRPHSQRIVRVTSDTLLSWASALGESANDKSSARMIYLVNRDSTDVLIKMAHSPRLAELDAPWTYGWNETNARRDGFIAKRSAIADSWRYVILQGFQITNANPLFKQPNPSMRSNRDSVEIDLESIPDDFIPRTSYQPAKASDAYFSAYTKWGDRPTSDYFRLGWREMAKVGNIRTLQSAILPPGPQHLLTIYSMQLDDSDLVVASGFTASLLTDFLMKVSTTGHINCAAIGRTPHIRGHQLEEQLVLRVLRLNCLTSVYAPLWKALFKESWTQDAWVPHIGVDNSNRLALGDVQSEWEWLTPIRNAADRRQALVELDAIVAIMLDISADELLTVYRTQFPVLQKAEREALYDVNGRPLPAKLATEYRKHGVLKPEDLTVDGVTYVEPFVGVDRERDMELAHKHFSDIAAESKKANR